MNFKDQETAQKLRGGFYTEPAITNFLARWIGQIKPTTVLEPSCGDGAFFPSIVAHAHRAQITAFELNEAEASKSRERAPRGAAIKNGDFLAWYLSEDSTRARFDSVLGNPPFIRYQYLPPEQQALAERVFKKLHLPFTKHTNAWVPFVVASVELLRPGGRLAMVVPSEIFHIPHAQGLRDHLARECSQVLLIDPQEIWFADTLQGTVLLLAQKAQPGEAHQGVGVASVADKEFLADQADQLFEDTLFSNGATTQGKWMKLFLTQNERDLLQDLKQHPHVRPFEQLASVDVGIVTGANKFFLVPDATVNEYGLRKWAYPMFGRSDHVQGLIFKKSDYAQNRKQGLPTNFLWLKGSRNSFPGKVQRYLELGESQKLQTRYKCRIRDPWFTVPSVQTAPIAMLKRSHHFPRLVLNSAKAYTTDTAYRIRPLPSVKAENLVLSFVNSLTLLTAELEGRHYGGGVLELVPSEIERLLIPVAVANARQLTNADELFRQTNDERFVRRQDQIVLSQIAISTDQREMLFGAWNRLRLRRQREKGPEEEMTD